MVELLGTTEAVDEVKSDQSIIDEDVAPMLESVVIVTIEELVS